VVTLVDTSALYAFLDRRDANHATARATFELLLGSGDGLVTHGYAVVETCALVQRRLGALAVRSLFDDLLPVIDTWPVDEETHRLAVAALLGSGSRTVSLVDWTSFTLMRGRGVDRAFAFDADFDHHGFPTIPAHQQSGDHVEEASELAERGPEAFPD
jgi:predicted nucleic acid-binding protein